MKVYRVQADVNNYQYFMIDDVNTALSDMMMFDGTPKADMWRAPPVFVYKPKKKKGDFPNLWATATIVVNQSALIGLRDLLEMSGELLPIEYKGVAYHVANVTECVDVLDASKSEWMYEPGSGPIKRYSFRSDRFSESPLFKIPETCKSEILTIEGMKDPEDEFKGRVERMGLKGLIFEEVWSA